MKTVGQMIHDKELHPGQVLHLENGTQLLVGHVNSLFGRTEHCLTPEILTGVQSVTELDWDSLQGWDVGPKADPQRIVPEAVDLLDILSFYGLIKAGDAIELGDGSRLVIGHINERGGTCDAGWEASEDDDAPKSHVLRKKSLL